MDPPGPSSSQYGSRYSMSRTCGPRDIISLFIPRIGDNTTYIGYLPGESAWFTTVVSKLCFNPSFGHKQSFSKIFGP
jgi:hypothetical protein